MSRLPIYWKHLYQNLQKARTTLTRTSQPDYQGKPHACPHLTLLSAEGIQTGDEQSKAKRLALDTGPCPGNDAYERVLDALKLFCMVRGLVFPCLGIHHAHHCYFIATYFIIKQGLSNKLSSCGSFSSARLQSEDVLIITIKILEIQTSHFYRKFPPTVMITKRNRKMPE